LSSHGLTFFRRAWSYALSIISLISYYEVFLVSSNILCNYYGLTTSDATGSSIGIYSLLHHDPVNLNVFGL